MQDDHTHERTLAQLGKLMDLRPTFLHHKSVLVSIDHAIVNVFEPENHDEISKYITKLRELVDTVRKMNELGAGTTSVDFRLPNLRVSEAKPQYQKVNAKYEELRDVKQQLAALGIPTVGVENAMADILIKHDAVPAVNVQEEPATMKQEPPSGSSELSTHVPSHSGGHDLLITHLTTESASRIKRAASIGYTANANPNDVFQGEANEAKRRKASLNVLSRGAKECTEAWKIPVNEIGTEGLTIMSTEPDGSLSLSFDTKTQIIVVFLKEQCLSLRYPCLKLIPACIQSIKRNSPQTKENFKARLSVRDGPKLDTIDIIFPTIKDWETFLEKIRSSGYQRLLGVPESPEVMDKMWEEGLWLVEKTRLFGSVAKVKTFEMVELE